MTLSKVEGEGVEVCREAGATRLIGLMNIDRKVV